MADTDASRPTPTQPRDVVDGIPDRSARPSPLKYLLVAAAFCGWLAVLLAVFLLGR